MEIFLRVFTILVIPLRTVTTTDLSLFINSLQQALPDLRWISETSKHDRENRRDKRFGHVTNGDNFQLHSLNYHHWRLVEKDSDGSDDWYKQFCEHEKKLNSDQLIASPLEIAKFDVPINKTINEVKDNTKEDWLSINRDKTVNQVRYKNKELSTNNRKESHSDDEDNLEYKPAKPKKIERFFIRPLPDETDANIQSNMNQFGNHHDYNNDIRYQPEVIKKMDHNEDNFSYQNSKNFKQPGQYFNVEKHHENIYKENLYPYNQRPISSEEWQISNYRNPTEYHQRLNSNNKNNDLAKNYYKINDGNLFQKLHEPRFRLKQNNNEPIYLNNIPAKQLIPDQNSNHSIESLYKPINYRVDDQIDKQRNDLSHEADYKLSKIEQERIERQRSYKDQKYSSANLSNLNHDLLDDWSMWDRPVNSGRHLLSIDYSEETEPEWNPNEIDMYYLDGFSMVNSTDQNPGNHIEISNDSTVNVDTATVTSVKILKNLKETILKTSDSTCNSINKSNLNDPSELKKDPYDRLSYKDENRKLLTNITATTTLPRTEINEAAVITETKDKTIDSTNLENMLKRTRKEIKPMNDMISGKLPNDITNAIFQLVDAKHLAPELQFRRITNVRDVKSKEIFNSKNKSNTIQSTESMVKDILDTINSLKEDQRQRKTCIPLTDDLQEFYNRIVSTNRKLRRASKLYHIDMNKSNSINKLKRKVTKEELKEKAKIVNQLLDEYKSLSIDDQLKLPHMKGFLTAHLALLDKMFAGQYELQSYKADELKDDKEVTNQFRKLYQAVDYVKRNSLLDLSYTDELEDKLTDYNLFEDYSYF